MLLEKIRRMALRFEEIERSLATPEVAAKPEKLRVLMQERKTLLPIAEAYRAYAATEKELQSTREIAENPDEDRNLRDMAAEELPGLQKQLAAAQKTMQTLLLTRDENDERNVIMEIRAGAGGEEAALFAADLFRMYSMYAAAQGWRIDPMNANATELGGYREISFMVMGEGAFSRLKFEGGVHRVQRVPKTESQGRIQTSTVTVAVLPEVEDIQLTINPQDLTVETLKSSGAGGQHINKTESAVRIYHKPSGLVVFCQEERSQMKNRDKAMKMLRALLYEREQQKQADSVGQARRIQVGSGDRSEKIRTYNYPQGRVTDHRIGLTMYQLENFMNGDLRDMIDALTEADTTERLKGEDREN